MASVNALLEQSDILNGNFNPPGYVEYCCLFSMNLYYVCLYVAAFLKYVNSVQSL